MSLPQSVSGTDRPILQQYQTIEQKGNIQQLLAEDEEILSIVALLLESGIF